MPLNQPVGRLLTTGPAGGGGTTTPAPEGGRGLREACTLAEENARAIAATARVSFIGFDFWVLVLLADGPTLEVVTEAPRMSRTFSQSVHFLLRTALNI